MLDDLTTRDQRMMFAVVTLVHLADSKEELDSDTETLQSAARKHLCQLATLNWQQADGLTTALPLGLRRIDALRTLTTEALAVLMPFKAQEIRDQGGVYYGQNVISKNLEGRPGSIRIRAAYLLRVDRKIRKDFNHYTLPIVGNYFFWGGGVTIFSAIIGHLGNDAVAANSLANIVKNTLACVSKGLGTAGAILVGNELGKDHIQLAKRYAARSVQLAGIIGGVTCGLLLMLRPAILRFSNLSEQATGYLSGMLLICSYYMIAGAINNMAIGGIFCAGGKSRFGCICDGVVLWLIVMPLALLAAFTLKLPVLVVYFILCLDECIKVPVVFWYYRRYTWAQNLTRL